VTERATTPSSAPPDTKASSPEALEHAARQYTLVVERQDALEKPETRRSEAVLVRCAPGISVQAALVLARTAQDGAPPMQGGSIAFEGECLEGVCGACAMLINGRVALACTTLIGEVADKQQRVRLAPMKKFPLVRDLVVDRSRLARTLSSVPVAGPPTPGAPLPHAMPSATEARKLARLDQCHRCGACLEACPQYGAHSEFVGAATLHEVHVRNSTPGAKHERRERIEAMMAPGGVQHCGKAQNCVEVCPADLPLVDSIQSIARETSKRLLFGWWLG
jgi:succinate dehydrogenase / fumarate reductase, iron-sulfur subunit